MEEAMEELIMGSKDQTHIVKGKRTKRQRPQSPIPFAIITTTVNSSSGDHGYGSNFDKSSHTTSADNNEFMVDTSNTTDEEEDMANCLILLARGGHSRNSTNPKQYDDDTSKFSSKRYVENSGIYVYECKTCSRAFPSFQALGGHRASHKKPKAENKKPLGGLSDDDDDEQPQHHKKNHEYSSSTLSLQLSNKAPFGDKNNKFKVHECSICGAEFSSGQALGGHMRRHRGPISATYTALLSLSPSDHMINTEPEEAKKQKNGLSLDLNLPADPEDDHDHHRESKFGFGSKQQKRQQQQSALVLSTAPSLVDCHY